MMNHDISIQYLRVVRYPNSCSGNFIWEIRLFIIPQRQRITSNDHTIRNEYIIKSSQPKSCPPCFYIIIFDEPDKYQMANILSWKCSFKYI